MTLTLVDLVVIYLLPVAAAAALLVAGTVTIYALVRSPLEFDFKADLRRRYEAKRKNPSGANVRFSYGYVTQLLLADNGVQATLLYRVSRFLVRRRLRRVAGVVHAFAKFLTHIDISPEASVGPGVYFYHGLGTVIGKNTTIGARALICQGVTTGSGRPRIGDDVKLWAGAKVIGNVTVGDGAEIGANAVVLTDVPPACVAVGVPATRFIPKPAPVELAVEHDAVATPG